MESRASVARKIKVRNLPKINLDIYSMISLNNLVIYAVHFLQQREVTATVEEVVSICFRLFPQSFALKNYPRWPDSALVIRRLNDGREKGNLKGNSMDGFLVKYKGKQLAKKVAKALGFIKPAKAKLKRTKVVSQKKISIAPVIKKSTKKRLSKPLNRAIKAKQEVLPLIKVEEKPRKQSVKLPLPTPVTKAPAAQSVKTRASAKIQKTRLTKTSPVKQKRARQLELFKGQPKQAIKVSSTSVSVPKEVKVRAGKFVRLMERSDAYIHYKKNGKNAKIGEFDFRSMLLCTMESSRETLVKNMELFKGYAGIHNHQGLLTFLSHCEDKFSYLLAAPQKQLKKPVQKSRKYRKEI